MVAGVASVALGVVLLVAGLAKRADPLWRLKAAQFGVPAWSARAVPYVELVLGAVLIVGAGRPFAAWLAAVLLLGFTVMMVFLFAQRRRPPCACFGARSSKPIGAWSIVRNLLLIALAVVAAIG